MNSTIRAAFADGAGVDPAHMKLILATISVAVVLVVALWVAVQLTDAWRNEQLTTREIVYGLVKVSVLVLLLLYVILLV